MVRIRTRAGLYTAAEGHASQVDTSCCTAGGAVTPAGRFEPQLGVMVDRNCAYPPYAIWGVCTISVHHHTQPSCITPYGIWSASTYWQRSAAHQRQRSAAHQRQAGSQLAQLTRPSCGRWTKNETLRNPAVIHVFFTKWVLRGATAELKIPF